MRMERRVLTATLPKSSVHSSRLPRRRKGRIFFASLASFRSCIEACCAAARSRHDAGHGASKGAAERPARSAIFALCATLCAARRSVPRLSSSHSSHIPPCQPADLGTFAALDDDPQPNHVEAHEPQRQSGEERGHAEEEQYRDEGSHRNHLPVACLVCSG